MTLSWIGLGATLALFLRVLWVRASPIVLLALLACAPRQDVRVTATDSAETTSLDWVWLRDQRTQFFRSALGDFTSEIFRSPELDGCVYGWKSTYGSGQAYGLPARLLDWALTADADDRDMALHWLRKHVLHVMRHETWWDTQGVPHVAGEACTRHPVRSDADMWDGDILRHWHGEPYARAVLTPGVPLTMEERAEVRQWLRAWGTRLAAMTSIGDMAVSQVFYEGAYSRFAFTIDNLTWFFLATGETSFLRHAEDLVVGSLTGTKRGPGTPWPAPVNCWAASDPCECGGRALGNPNAPHRHGSAWHVGDSGRRLLAFYVTTRNETARARLRDWVLTQTALGCNDGHPMLTGGEERLDGTYRAPTPNEPAPPALQNPRRALGLPVGTRYQLLAGRTWYWDQDYFALALPCGLVRMFYPPRTQGVHADVYNHFGWADLWWLRYLLTRDILDRDRALVLLRDRLYYANVSGASKLVTIGARTGWPWGGGNVSKSRGAAWCAEAGSLIPWDGSAEVAGGGMLR